MTNTAFNTLFYSIMTQPRLPQFSHQLILTVKMYLTHRACSFYLKYKTSISLNPAHPNKMCDFPIANAVSINRNLMYDPKILFQIPNSLSHFQISGLAQESHWPLLLACRIQQ